MAFADTLEFLVLAAFWAFTIWRFATPQTPPRPAGLLGAHAVRPVRRPGVLPGAVPSRGRAGRAGLAAAGPAAADRRRARRPAVHGEPGGVPGQQRPGQRRAERPGRGEHVAEPACGD